MKITFLGTCSGTEPMLNRHYSSFVIELGDQVYWFDAGENCSHMAHTLGIDLSHIRAIFISHMHIDHIGGLPNLLFVIDKLSKVNKKLHIHNNSYDVFVPELDVFHAVKTTACKLNHTPNQAEIREHEIGDGLLFEDEYIRVHACHNTHLKEDGSQGFHSYSFLIEAEGKRIVFSGDVGYPEEMDIYTENGCDVLIMETGHHKLAKVFAYANERNVKKLLFTHHGREILYDLKGAEEMAKIMHPDARICNDGDVIVL